MPEKSRSARAAPFAAPSLPLSGADRKSLRARAHFLDPVVRVGDAGLTDAVIAETSRALDAHGLIKVRVFGDDRSARDSVAQRLCEQLGCAPVQSIGKLLVLYRPQPLEHRPGPRPQVRRRLQGVPKKLAAEGVKSAPRRRKPAPDRAPAQAPARAPRPAAAGKRSKSPARPTGRTTARAPAQVPAARAGRGARATGTAGPTGPASSTRAVRSAGSTGAKRPVPARAPGKGAPLRGTGQPAPRTRAGRRGP